jgi:hypothetical protein
MRGWTALLPSGGTGLSNDSSLFLKEFYCVLHVFRVSGGWQSPESGRQTCRQPKVLAGGGLVAQRIDV